ncbi:MAG: nucleotidyltransferase domain-containing protein [Armatimonadetes bacterium]|nr:nucleotidyltransferase domain-containing protein [Armatimonadota bacterium]
MIDLIRDNLDKIRALCEQHHVQRLDVFGSAADGRYREGESDVDLVVEFEPVPWEVRADSYLALEAALRDVLAQTVDLVTKPPPERRNPYFWRSVEQEREVVYERTSEEVPV